MPKNTPDQPKTTTSDRAGASKEERRRTRRAKLAAYHEEKTRQERRRKITMAVSAVAAFVLVIAGVVAIAAFNSGDDAAGGSVVLRDDDRRLQTASDGKVTVVEFLDMECEACGALFPTVEQVREKYDGKVTFAIRYFPTHANSVGAAKAVEAAGAQDKYEEMYTMMFENQREWAEQQTPQDAKFRAYAEEVGLDMAEFDQDFGSADLEASIDKDKQDGLKAGVQGTPTFFLNGEQIETPVDVEGFSTVLDQALAS